MMGVFVFSVCTVDSGLLIRTKVDARNKRIKRSFVPTAQLFQGSTDQEADDVLERLHNPDKAG